MTRVATLPELFAEMGDVVAVDRDGDHHTSAAEIEALAGRVQAGFVELGLRRGDRVAVWLPNCAEYLALLWAAARLGIVIVSVNTRYRSSEVADIVGRSGCRRLILDPGFLGIDFAGILADVPHDAWPNLDGLITLGEGDHRELGWPAVSFQELQGHGEDHSDHSSPDLPYIVFTTSGTTRAPKLVLHRQASPAAHAADLASWFGGSALVAVPLCGVFGYTVMLGALGARATQVMLPVFDGALAAHAVERHAIETFHGSDEMVARMIETGADLSSLGPVGYARFNNALEGLPGDAARAGVGLVGLYGMSEVHALFAHRPPEPADRLVVPGGALVSPTAQARVADPETGEALAPGLDGELQLRGPSLFAGYLADGGTAIDEELTGEHFVDGWFRTGDLARMDGANSFEYLARMGDVLRLGGFLVSPAEIEERLLEDPSVDAVQVVGVDLAGGPRAVAFVVAADHDAGIDEEALRQHCRSGLAGFKVPARILAIDDFPTTASANGTKIQKVVLRSMAAEAMA